MATSTISNTITGPTGTAVSGATVRATLMPGPGFRVSDSTEVARVVTTTTNGSGAWSLALERNTNITPTGTWYLIEEEIPVAQGGSRTHAIQVGASNQTLLAALISTLPTITASGYLTQAAADARYQALGSLGSGTPATLVPDGAGTAGVSTAASRDDHNHPIAAAVPVATGDANAEGTGNDFARATHVHKGVVANDAWTTYTPSLTQSGTVTKTVSYAAYQRMGRMITVLVRLIVTGTGTGANAVVVGLPVTASAANLIAGSGIVFDSSASAVYKGLVNLASTTTVRLYYAGDTTVSSLGQAGFTAGLASNDEVQFCATYEAAS